MQKRQVIIRCDSVGRVAARKLADYLDVPVIESRQSPQSKYLLELESGELALKAVSMPKLKPILLNFNFSRPGKGKDPLIRAMGPKARTVVDGTAGWCSDALHIARYGKKVTAIEKNRIVFAMIEFAAQTIHDPELKSRFEIMEGNSIDILESLADFPDVIYLDPMYPEKTKSAAVRKELEILKDIIGEQDDCRQLFRVAIARAGQRVVVKRPLQAAPIAPGKVGETRGKLVRFDIYKPRCN